MAQPQEVPLEVVAHNFKQLQLELRAQGLTQHIRNFAGEGSKRFTEWVKDMERVGSAVQADTERKKSVSLQTLSGLASYFLVRYFRDNPQR